MRAGSKYATPESMWSTTLVFAGFRSTNGGNYAAAGVREVSMWLSIDCVNCASTSSAIVMTSGNRRLKSKEFKLLCNVPKSVTCRIRDSCTSIAGV
jgi:hypothetical protein